MITLYGIKNCDTVKKARKWLEQNSIEYQFHDYKTQGVPAEEFRSHLEDLGWEAMINRRGTTWRKLPDTVKEATGEENALELICENSSLIKRPLVIDNGRKLLGFKPELYTSFFSNQS